MISQLSLFSSTKTICLQKLKTTRQTVKSSIRHPAQGPRPLSRTIRRQPRPRRSHIRKSSGTSHSGSGRSSDVANSSRVAPQQRPRQTMFACAFGVPAKRGERERAGQLRETAKERASGQTTLQQQQLYDTTTELIRATEISRESTAYTFTCTAAVNLETHTIEQQQASWYVQRSAALSSSITIMIVLGLEANLVLRSPCSLLPFQSVSWPSDPSIHPSHIQSLC